MKKPDRHLIFVNQMYNLVKPMAHPAGFEPTACRLGGGRSILLSYGCMALVFKASSVFRLRVVANISNNFLLDVRTGSDKFRKLFEHAFANSEDFLSTSCHLTISAFHQMALACLYLRRRPLYPTELQVQAVVFQRLAPFRLSTTTSRI